MTFRNILTAAAILILAAASASAATLVIPAAGTGPGAFGSQWQSEITIHNAAPRDIEVSLSFHQGTSVFGPEIVAVDSRATISLEDVVKSEFGVESGAGAIVLTAADRDATGLVVTSRTTNVFAGGEFGQDIPALDPSAAATSGDIAVVHGPSVAAGHRLNTGIFALEESVVHWQLVRADGTLGNAVEREYAAGAHAQYGNAVEGLLAGSMNDNDTVYARIVSGKAIVYGSIVNTTGDPTWVPGIPARDDIRIVFTGIDLDENGSVDVRDADGDGVLDSPISIRTSLFPAYFRLVAEGEFGETVTFEIASSPTRADLLDTVGTMRVVAGADVNGSTGAIEVKATAGDSSATLTIPVIFK